jgi:hypothetical protein
MPLDKDLRAGVAAGSAAAVIGFVLLVIIATA